MKERNVTFYGPEFEADRRRGHRLGFLWFTAVLGLAVAIIVFGVGSLRAAASDDVIVPVSVEDTEPNGDTSGLDMWFTHTELLEIRRLGGLTAGHVRRMTPSPQAAEYSSRGGHEWHGPTGVERWRPLVAKYFNAVNVPTMMCLMAFESGGSPTAKNPKSSARGLFQVMASIWAPVYNVSYEDLYDPEINTWVAAGVLGRQGYTAWSPYNRGECHGL